MRRTQSAGAGDASSTEFIRNNTHGAGDGGGDGGGDEVNAPTHNAHGDGDGDAGAANNLNATRNTHAGNNSHATRDAHAGNNSHATRNTHADGGDNKLDAELDARILKCALRLQHAASVVALTGAGLSVESGIPPFRGPGGLWTRYGEPPLDGYQRFLRDPAAAWRERLHPSAGWARGLAETLARAAPNAGHFALAALEAAGCCDALITQNIDDLHRQAGTRTLHEIHGNHFWLRCIECHRRFDPARLPVDEAALPPHCPHCDGLVKADTVSFGEPIPPHVLRACTRAVARCDVMLVVGTSATVFPAAEFPHEVLHRGGAVIEINPHASEFTPRATCSLRGPATTILTRLLHHIRTNASDGDASRTNTNTRAGDATHTNTNAARAEGVR